MHKRVCAMNAMQFTIDNYYHIRSRKNGKHRLKVNDCILLARVDV